MDLENVGNQGAFKEFAKSSEKINKSSGVFNSSAGMMMAAVMSLDVISQRIGGGLRGAKNSLTDQLKTFIREPIKIMGISSIVDSIVHLGNQIVETKVALGKDMGIAKDKQTAFLSSLMSQHSLLSQYGVTLQDNYESYKALYSDFRNLETPLNKDLVSVTALMAQSFNLSEESAAGIVSSFVMFGKKDAKQIQRFSDKLVNDSIANKVNYKAVGKQLAGISGHMYKFNLSSESGMNNIKDMAIFSEKAGINLGRMLEATDKYRNIQEAMQASTTASRWGLRIDPRALIAASRGGDQTMLLKTILQKMKGFMDSSGRVSQIGIDVADNLAPLIGMDREELLKATRRIAMNTGVSIQGYMDQRKMLEENRGYLERIKVSLNDMLMASIYPMASKLFPIIESGMKFLTKWLQKMKEPFAEFTSAITSTVVPYLKLFWTVLSPVLTVLGKIASFIMKSEGLIRTLVNTTIAWYVFDKAYKISSMIKNKVDLYKYGFGNASAAMSGRQMVGEKLLWKFGRGDKRSRLFGAFGKELHQVQDWQYDKRGRRIKGFTKRGRFGDIGDSSSRKMSGKMGKESLSGKLGGQNNVNMMASQAKKWMFGAAALLLVAGSVWVMADALGKLKGKNVDWKQMGLMVAGLTAMTAAVIGIGLFMSSGIGALAIIAGAGALLIMASAINVLGSASQKFAPIAEVLFNWLSKLTTVIGRAFVDSLSGISNLVTTLSKANPLTVAANMTSVSLGYASMAAGGVLSGIAEKITGAPREIQIRTNELSEEIKKLASALAVSERFVPIYLTTEVKLDTDVLVRKITNATMRII